jgi:hypothetical protein
MHSCQQRCCGKSDDPLHAVHDGRIPTEKTTPSSTRSRGSGAEFGAGIKSAVERGWLDLHECGTYVRLLTRGKDLLAKAWPRPLFDEPIVLPNGGKLVTLLDAGEYISVLPKKEHQALEWQAATEALILVAEGGSRPCLPASVSYGRWTGTTSQNQIIKSKNHTGADASWTGSMITAGP